MSECCMTRDEGFRYGISFDIQNLVEKAYQRGYKVGKDEAYKSPLTKDAYMQGMNDTWNVMQKFYEMSNADMESIGLPVNDMVSPHSNIYYILQNISVNEAFDLIRAYEEQKKQEENEEIKVGDEVYILDENYLSVVTSVYEDNGKKNAVCITQSGKWDVNTTDALHRTGRHFQEIAEVLKKLREGE